jgi:two-component system LytT family response regulator
MPLLQALIVDDEPLGRERLRHLLSEREDIEVKADATDGGEAIERLSSDDFDLVFLDIQMPKVDGFEVVEGVGPEAMPPVIFCTAHDEYALEAFRLHALDYLLKPIDADRFHASVDRVVDLVSSGKPDNLEEKLSKLLAGQGERNEPVRRFMIKAHQQITFVRDEDIDWIEAAGNYLELHAGKDVHLLRQTMKDIESRLDPERFMRIHRSTIVNMDRVRDLHQMFNGEYEVRLTTGQKLTMSRTYRKNLDRFA